MQDNRFSGRDKGREVRVGTLGININVCVPCICWDIMVLYRNVLVY